MVLFKLPRIKQGIDPYQDWTIAHWVTPYKSDNTTYQSNPPSSEFYSGTFRFRLTSSVYIEESTPINSRLQLHFGYWGLGCLGTAPNYFYANIMNPYGTSSYSGSPFYVITKL